MYKFKANEKEFEIPTKWEELTMRHYMEIIKIPINDQEYIRQLLFNIVNMSEEDVNEMTLAELNTVLQKFDYLTKEPNFKAKKVVNFNGEVYSFAASLNHLKLGEVISIKTYQEKYGEESLPYIIAILLRKGNKDEKGKFVQEKFDASSIEQRVKLFMDLPVTEFIGSLNFFLNGIKTS